MSDVPSDVMASLRAYSDALVARGPKSFVVPELLDRATGEPIRIFVWPITGLQKREIMKSVADGDKMGIVARTIVQRAMDENRRPLFAEKDIEDMLALSLGDLLEGISIQISQAWSLPTVEEARGN